MIFANPVFLLGLIAGAVPVVIHLAGKKRAQTLQFPSLRFVMQVEQSLARRYRLRELLLLAMRVAALCLIASALALPRLTSEAFSSLGGRDTSTIFVIDNTMGMSRRCGSFSALALVKQAAAEWIETLGNQERAALLPVHGEEGTTPALTTDRGALIEQLSRIEPTYRSGTAREVLRVACRALEKETTINRRIVVFSDFAEPFLPDEVTIPGGIRVFALQPVFKEAANLFVQNFRKIPSAPGTTALAFDAVNAGNRAARGEVVLAAGGKVLSRRQVLVPAGGIVQQQATITKPEASRFSVRITSSADCLDRDDLSFLSINAPGKVPVLLVKERESLVPSLDETFYLQRALSVQSKRMQLTSVLQKDLEATPLENFAVVFLGGLSFLSTTEMEQMDAYVKNGGTLFFIAGDLMNLAVYRKYGQRAFPLLPVSVDTFADIQSVPIGWLDMKHGALKRLGQLTPEPDLFSVWFQRVLRIEEPQPPARVLIRLANGMPLCVEKQSGRGAVLFFAAALTPRAGNLPLRVAFLPFLDCFVQEAGRPRIDRTTLSCGEFLPAPFGYVDPVITGPGGEVPSQQNQRTGALRFGPFQAPGFYRITGSGDTGGGERSFFLAVNTPRSESSLQVLPRGTIRARLNAEAVVPLDHPRRAVEAMRQLSTGKDLRNFFLIACLCILSAEGICSAFWAFRRAGRG